RRAVQGPGILRGVGGVAMTPQELHAIREQLGLTRQADTTTTEATMYLTIRSDRVTDERVRALLEAGGVSGRRRAGYDRARRALQADPRGGRGVSQDAVLAQLLAIRAQ